MTSEQTDLLESLIEGVIILNEDEIVFTNKTIKTMLGYSPEEILPPLTELFPSQYYLKTFMKTINKDTIKYLELEILKKNGEVISANISISTFYNGELEPLFKVIIIRDISELDQAREKGIVQFKLFALNQVSTALIHFESHSRGPVLKYHEPLLFKHTSTANDENFLLKTALFYLTAVGGGSSYSCGVFGPLPIYETDDYLSIVYTAFLKNPEALDKRSKGKDYFMYIMIFPKYLEKIFTDRKALKTTLSKIFEGIEFSKNFTNEIFSSIKEQVVFKENTSSSAEQRFLERKLAAITELSTEANTIFDIDTAFEAFTAFAEKVLDFKLFTLFITKENQQKLTIGSYRGYSDESLVGWETDISAENSLVAKCARTKEVINIPDVMKIDFYYPVLDSIRSELAVPIIFDKIVLGVINVESIRLNAFTAQDERLMIALASIIAGFLSKRNYERTLRETFELNRILSETKSIDEVYNNILIFVERVLKLPIFSINIISRRANTINLVGCIGYSMPEKYKDMSLQDEKGIVRYAALTGNNIILQDVSNEPKYLAANPDVKSEVAIVIKSYKKVIGVINAEKLTLDGFSNDDVALLHALAKVTSTYVVQKRLEELTNTLFNFAEKLVDINNLVDVFKEIIESIKSTQDYEYLTISIVDHEHETVNLVAYYGFTGSLDHIKTLDLMLTKSVVVQAAREGRIIRINNITKDNAYVPIEHDAIKSEIAVPFFSEDGIILGIINVESKYLNSFNKDDQIILEKFGRILAKAFRKFSTNDIRLMKFE